MISKVGQSGEALEKFLKDLRQDFLKKKYIKSRKFCLVVLSCLTDSCDPKSNKRHLLEVFDWLHDILSVQLSTEVASSIC